jgi:hypothetical protein
MLAQSRHDRLQYPQRRHPCGHRLERATGPPRNDPSDERRGKPWIDRLDGGSMAGIGATTIGTINAISMAGGT